MNLHINFVAAERAGTQSRLQNLILSGGWYKLVIAPIGARAFFEEGLKVSIFNL